MQTLDKIDAATAVLRRIDAMLAVVNQAGPEAQLAHVMEMTGLMREQLGRALSILEDEIESEYSERNVGGPALAQSAPAPAHGGAAVVTLRPPQRS